MKQCPYAIGNVSRIDLPYPILFQKPEKFVIDFGAVAEFKLDLLNVEAGIFRRLLVLGPEAGRSAVGLIILAISAIRRLSLSLIIIG